MNSFTGIIITLFSIVACTVIEAFFATALFYALTIYTQIPVDNNALWIGACVITGCIFIMLVGFALIGAGNDRKKKHTESR